MYKVSYTGVSIGCLTSVVLLNIIFSYNFDLFNVLVITLVIAFVWNFIIDLLFTSMSKHEQEINKLRDMYEAKLVKARKLGRDDVFKTFIHNKDNFIDHLNDFCVREGYPGNYYDKTKSKTVHNWMTVLGVSENATKEDVEKAYRELVKKYHPDINKSASASQSMMNINAAKDQADKYFAKM